MSSIPQRPSVPMIRMSKAAWISVSTLAGIACLTMFLSLVVPGAMGWTLIVFIGCIVGSYLIFATNQIWRGQVDPAHVKNELDLDGYTILQEDFTFSRDFSDALELLRPHKIAKGTRKLTASVVENERDVLVATVLLSNGKQQVPFSVVGVMTAREWTPAIVRRRNLIDRFKHDHDLGHPAFDAQREVVADRWADALDEIRPLAEWFVTNDHQPFTFKLKEVPGKREQWSFCGHWAVRAEPGYASAEHIMQTVQFMLAFASSSDAVEAQTP